MFFPKKQKAYVRINDFIIFSNKNYLVPADEYLVIFALKQKENFEKRIEKRSKNKNIKDICFNQSNEAA